MKIDQSAYQVNKLANYKGVEKIETKPLEAFGTCHVCGSVDIYPDDMNYPVKESFKEFTENMDLESLGFSEKELKHIEKLYNEVMKLDDSGQVQKGDELWNKMMNIIDDKIAEAAFDQFAKDIDLKSFKLSKEETEEVKKLFIETDKYILEGQLTKATESWDKLMAKLQAKQPDFEKINLEFPVDQIDDDYVTITKEAYEKLMEQANSKK